MVPFTRCHADKADAGTKRISHTLAQYSSDPSKTLRATSSLIDKGFVKGNVLFTLVS